ncbi:MAG: SusE domain-containing protein [Sphingobacteriales bacterium]|nr:MAG: SusE domain-containing protein [Sphingobacteriales bacterium]
MKQIILFLFILFAISGFVACEKEGDTITVKLLNNPNITAPVSGVTYVFTEETAGDTLPVIKWTEANFNYQAAITYRVEVATAGTSFATPQSLGSLSGTEFSLTVGSFNSSLIAMGLTPFEEAALELRIVGSVSDFVENAYSNVVAMTVTPYLSIPVFPMLQVPGSYQGWAPSNLETAIPSVKSDGKYEGYIFFPNDNTEFKFTQGLNWDVNWGDDGANGTLDPNGANIIAPLAGLHKLNVNLPALTFTQLKTDWGLIGSATPGGWDSDQDLTYDAATRSMVITLDLVAGEIKFRANDDWGLNYGDTGADGKLEEGGDNIAIAEAGNYTIAFDLKQTFGNYTYTITKN